MSYISCPKSKANNKNMSPFASNVRIANFVRHTLITVNRNYP